MHIPKQTPWWEKLLMSGFNNAQQGAQMAAMGG
jgi:hypothetical protein